MEQTLLQCRDVTIERGYRVLLSGVSVTVSAGELWQFSGANGVGKSSLLRAIAGLATFGVDGVIERLAPLLYQGHLPALKPLLNPLENLHWHPSGEQPADTAVALEALATVGLAGYEEAPVHRLSAGQQRRVGLARLWLTDAPLWLLDEPFTAIDVRGAELLEQRLLAHAATGGAVVFTSHQPSRFGDQLNVMNLAHYAD